MPPSTPNYAKLLGIESVAAAIVFAVVFSPLFLYFVVRTIRNVCQVLVLLSFFCAMRVTAYILRAILASSESEGHNLTVLIIEAILLGVGYFSLLFSTYTLVLSRLLTLPEDNLTDKIPLIVIFNRFMRNAILFRVVLLVAVTLGILGATAIGKINSDGSIQGAGKRKASTIIFLVLTILQALQTLLLVWKEISPSGRLRMKNTNKNSVGVRHGAIVLSVVACFLVIREVYTISTIDNMAREYNEHIWYPFVAVPEVLAVTMFVVPGLIPLRKELEIDSTYNPES